MAFKCPNCSLEQERTAECSGCHIIFAKWEERQLRASYGTPGPSAAAGEAAAAHGGGDKLNRVLPPLIGGTLLFLGAYNYFAPPAGKAPLPESLKVEDFFFAVKAPGGWTLEQARRTREDCVDVLKFTGPDSVRAGVVVSGKNSGRLRSLSGAKVSKLVAIAFPDGFNAYNQDSQEEIVVDGIKSLRVKGTARKIVPVTVTEMVDTRPAIGRWVTTSFGTGVPGPGRTSSTNIYASGTTPQLVAQDRVENTPMEYKFFIDIVPGAERSYLIATEGQTGHFQGNAPAIEELVSSFRVLERPFSAAHLFNLFSGEFRGEMIGLAIGVIFAFYKWVFSPLLE